MRFHSRFFGSRQSGSILFLVVAIFSASMIFALSAHKKVTFVINDTKRISKLYKWDGLKVYLKNEVNCGMTKSQNARVQGWEVQLFGHTNKRLFWKSSEGLHYAKMIIQVKKMVMPHHYRIKVEYNGEVDHVYTADQPFICR